MAGQQKIKKNDLGFLEQARLLTREEFTAMVGLTFVALGLVFVLGQANMLDYSSPWWTLFIGIPGLVFLVASALTIRQQGNLTAMAVAQLAIGITTTVLALSFILDPTWSFTQNWTLFRGSFWNLVWRWALVVIGALILAFGVLRRSIAAGIFGGILGTVGLVFVLDLSWNLVWPFAIIALGVGILLPLFRRET